MVFVLMIVHVWCGTTSCLDLIKFIILVSFYRAFESLQIMPKFVFLLQFETHSLSSIYVHCIVVISFGIMQMNKNLGRQER